MKQLFSVIIVLLYGSLSAQKTPADFGYRHLKIDCKNDVADVIIQSKKGEENKKKPMLFWCQGSLPQPVLKYDEKGIYGTFPFNPDDFLTTYHLVIVGKPGVPVISDVKKLERDYTYRDSQGKTPKQYSEHNHLDFYVQRNNVILQRLLSEKWISDEKVVVAGHSEGSGIAAKMASENKAVTHLIYSGGNPYGRILSIIAQSRFYDSDNNTIEYWKAVVDNKNDLTSEESDSFKTTYDFSVPVNETIEKLKKPVLITYGTKDWNAAYNDMFYVEAIRKEIKNITFIPFPGLEHNYFPVNEKMEPNHQIYNWENVGKEWVKWLTVN
ncbi:alpha/beta hydrolase [Flavobacterium enshiense]|uniref:alpha/beta hydrolase family protein n=1 Tax=Flavobacterium enshiense TaxID=1341165 RepID=UPI00345DCFCB